MRRGFTLVEFLVVLAVIFLIIACLLPAVKKAIDAAEQAKAIKTMPYVVDEEPDRMPYEED